MKQHKNYPVNLKEVFASEKNVYNYMSPSTLLKYTNLSNLIGADIYIKHENHNLGGSFKIRGGLNLMEHLKKDGVKGVITFSTGNHGLSTAISAKLCNIEATVVVPEGTNRTKMDLIKETGARLIVEGNNFEEASVAVERISREENLYFVHAANEPHLINGVGTEFLEIIKEVPDLDVIILPIGAGSELAAAITVLKTLKPEVNIIAVQAENSKAAYLSWKEGKILESENSTFAGGFATGRGFELPFSIYKDQLADFILLSEEEIKEGIAQSIKYTKNLAEGAGASTLRAAFKIKDKLKGKKVVLQMSGRNEDESIIKEVLKDYLWIKEYY